MFEMVRRVGLLVTLALAGCRAYDPTLGYYGNPLGPGAMLEVREEIRVPAGLARVYVQYGKAMGYGAIDQYAPFCYLLMREPLPVVQRIGPGILRVESVSLNETEVSRPRPLWLAAAGLFADSNGDGRGVIAYQSYMRIAADGQPDIYALVCSGAFAAPMEAQPMRLAELRQAFGDLAEIRVRASPGSD